MPPGDTLGGFDGRPQPLDGLRPPLLDVALAIDFGGESVGAVVLLAVLVTACLVLRRPRMAVLAAVGPGDTSFDPLHDYCP
jgi:undecaprenyl-diphosphatase